MNSFEPPPLPGQGGQDHQQASHNPYVSPAAGGTVDRSQAYGAAPQAPWGMPASYTHPRATTVLVLGILSVVVLPIFGPFAWAMGRKALKEVDAAPQPASNRSTLQAGMVLGIIGTVFLVLGVLALLLFVGLVFISTSTTTVTG